MGLTLKEQALVIGILCSSAFLSSAAIGFLVGFFLGKAVAP